MVTLAIPIAKVSTYGKSKSIGTLPHGYHFLKCQLAKTEFSVAMIMFLLLIMIMLQYFSADIITSALSCINQLAHV